MTAKPTYGELRIIELLESIDKRLESVIDQGYVDVALGRVRL